MSVNNSDLSETKAQKSRLALIAMILGILYILGGIYYFIQVMLATTDAENVVVALFFVLISSIMAPHFVCVLVAVIFNFLGWSMNSRGFILTAAILYAVSIILFPFYFMFVSAQMILLFIAFAKMPAQ